MKLNKHELINKYPKYIDIINILFEDDKLYEDKEADKTIDKFINRRIK